MAQRKKRAFNREQFYYWDKPDRCMLRLTKPIGPMNLCEDMCEAFKKCEEITIIDRLIDEETPI